VEVDEYFGKFCEANSMNIEEWQDLKELVIRRSECHPGLLTYMLDEAADVKPAHHKGDAVKLAAAFKKKLLSADFIRGLRRLRGFLR
jgi:hypothetical protein